MGIVELNNEKNKLYIHSNILFYGNQATQLLVDQCVRRKLSFTVAFLHKEVRYTHLHFVAFYHIRRNGSASDNKTVWENLRL